MQKPIPKPLPKRLPVFQFLDAREFLRQACEAEKRVNKGFSHRYIAKAMGAGSSSFFKDVLNGRAPLNPARAAKFARLFCLSAKETEYFANLVLYTQADDPEEKDYLLQKLSGGAGPGKQAVLAAFQSEYLKRWHYAAIRELLAITDFRSDYGAIAAMLDPPITPVEARDAVQLLLRLKLIRKNAQGGFEKADKVVVTGGGGDPKNARPGILENMNLARRALDLHAPAIRPFSYLTLSVSKDSLKYIQDQIRALRDDILDRVSRDTAVDRLYQMNIQLFPISKTAQPSDARAARKTSEREIA
jgi:uncharacterized protein (TIGR02147 family)